MIRYTKTKLNLFHHYFTHIIGNCIKPNFCPRDRRGTNNNTTRDKLCPLHFSMVFQECFYSFFLLVCKITAFSVYEIIQNLTLHPRDKERQSKIIAMDKPFLLQFNTVFGKWFYCFSLFWYAKFCPPFVPQKYSSKIYILIYNTLYNINIVCIGILAHFPISIYTRVKKGYLPRLIRKLISLSSIKPNLTAISRRRKRLLILPKYVYLKKHIADKNQTQ